MVTVTGIVLVVVMLILMVRPPSSLRGEKPLSRAQWQSVEMLEATGLLLLIPSLAGSMVLGAPALIAATAGVGFCMCLLGVWLIARWSFHRREAHFDPPLPRHIRPATHPALQEVLSASQLGTLRAHLRLSRSRLRLVHKHALTQDEERAWTLLVGALTDLWQSLHDEESRSDSFPPAPRWEGALPEALRELNEELPFSVHLSTSESRGRRTLARPQRWLHLEVRQKQSGAWFKRGFSAPVRRLRGEHLQTIPELSRSFSRVAERTLLQLLARLRGALLVQGRLTGSIVGQEKERPIVNVRQRWTTTTFVAAEHPPTTPRSGGMSVGATVGVILGIVVALGFAAWMGVMWWILSTQ